MEFILTIKSQETGASISFAADGDDLLQIEELVGGDENRDMEERFCTARIFLTQKDVEVHQ